MIDKFKVLLFPLLILLISYFIINNLIPDFHPAGGLRITISQDSLKKLATGILNTADIPFNEDRINIKFEENKVFTKWIRSEYKLDEANKILSKYGIAYYWHISQTLKDNDEIIVSSNSDENTVGVKSSFNLKMINNTNVISFEQQVPDSLIKTSLSSEQAKSLAINFIKRFRNDIFFIEDTGSTSLKKDLHNYFFKSEEVLNKPDRKEYTFVWETQTNELLNYRLSSTVIGDQFNSFQIEVLAPAQYSKNETDIFEIASMIVFVLLIVVLVLVVGFKRFRAYEVGFRLALLFGLFILFSFVIKEILEVINIFEFQLMLGLIFGGIFIAGAAILLWAISETLFREIWNDKFLSVDLIYHKKILHSKVGISLVNGISFSLGLTAVFLSILFLLSNYFNFSFIGDQFTSYSYATAKLPLLNVFFGTINAYGILAVAFLMFLTAAIKRYINNDTIFIIASALAWAFLVPSNVSPLAAGILINFVIGLILITILIKYDLLTTLLTFILFKYFVRVLEFSFTSDPVLNIQWNIIILITSALIAFSVILIFRKDRFTDYDLITPRFVENITERQRLQKELDVARHVQMSFLPKENPSIKGLDIYSTCIPALEVGGDYYDFIKIDDNKLGIIIGDVSGKGTQAAFYMTLTKGFIKAIAKTTESPAEVLTKMNELFYENVERGRFISMIYSVIDLQEMKIRIARAGHNPVLYHDNNGRISLINPKGLALGLERGKIFGDVISEYEETLEKGKIFIFYTDGFTEAVNKKGEEYGLERMYEVAKSYNMVSSKELLNKMMIDINKFIGKAKQHDDMTMVVLKII